MALPRRVRYRRLRVPIQTYSREAAWTYLAFPPAAAVWFGRHALAAVLRRLRALAARGYGTLLLRLPRAVRGDLRRGRRVRLVVTAIAADVAANTTTRARSMLLLP